MLSLLAYDNRYNVDGHDTNDNHDDDDDHDDHGHDDHDDHADVHDSNDNDIILAQNDNDNNRYITACQTMLTL